MRLAIYAGTFDPVTNGHLSVIRRAADLFDGLVVVVAVNPAKAPLFSAQERVEMIRDVTRHVGDVSCASTEELIVHFARARGARYLVRGVRGSTDTEAELALARANHDLAPEIETVFVPAHAELSEVSSSHLKELVVKGADVSSYCPPEIETRLRERLARVAAPEAAHV